MERLCFGQPDTGAPILEPHFYDLETGAEIQ